MVEEEEEEKKNENKQKVPTQSVRNQDIKAVIIIRQKDLNTEFA